MTMSGRFSSFAAPALSLLFCLGGTAAGQDLQSYVSPSPYRTVTVSVPAQDSEVRNIILMIGDGMGLEQISCAWVVNRGSLNVDNMPVTGLSRTYSANRLVTDSAAGGTALSCGVKTNNGYVAVSPDGIPLESLLDKAIAAGKKTGVVTTCRLNDATPATFCCNNIDRDEAEDIVSDYLECGVDYIAGGGLKYWRERSDGRDIVAEMEAEGYSAVLDPDSLSSVKNLPVLAVLADLELPPALERGDMYRNMVKQGITMLSEAGGENGFVMMLEGSCIDDWCHAGEIGPAMEELMDFDRTLGDVLEWAAADGHTLVIVTADHATGALTLQDGDLGEGKVSVAFGNDGHNGITVPYYAFGPGSSKFGGILENSELGRLIASFVSPQD